MKVLKEMTLDEILEYCKDGEYLCPSGSQYFYKDKKYHRDGDLPAIVVKVHSCVVQQEWWRDGKRHRDGDQPALCDSYCQEWWVDGVLVKRFEQDSEEYYLDGKLHSFNDQPAAHYTYAGEFYRGTYGDKSDPPGYDPDTHDYFWYCQGKKHRDNDLPAVIRDNGQTRQWWHHGVLHRDSPLSGKLLQDLKAVGLPNIDSVIDMISSYIDSPAVIIKYDNPRSYRNEWYKYGKKHRLYGPAVIDCVDGKITKQWWKDGVLINTST